VNTGFVKQAQNSRNNGELTQTQCKSSGFLIAGNFLINKYILLKEIKLVKWNICGRGSFTFYLYGIKVGLSKSAKKLLKLPEVHGRPCLMGPSLSAVFHGSSIHLLMALNCLLFILILTPLLKDCNALVRLSANRSVSQLEAKTN
jgi:hypothetical protein